jgi:hypothetical protein
MTTGATAITQAREAAELLPADGWLARIGEGTPDGPVERCWPPCAPPCWPATKAAGPRRAMAWKPKPRSSMARCWKPPPQRSKRWKTCASRCA